MEDAIKKIFTFIMVLFVGQVNMFAQWEEWGFYSQTGWGSNINVTVGSNPTISSYLIGGDYGTPFHGRDLGNLRDINEKISISYWNLSTWDLYDQTYVQYATLYYRVYETGTSTTGVGFQSINHSYTNGPYSNDYQYVTQWVHDGYSVDVTPVVLEAGKQYNLEVYIEVYYFPFPSGNDKLITGDGSNSSSFIPAFEYKYDNNGGSNYIATFSVDAPLPVELTSFNAGLRNGMVDLKWETKTEVSNYGFEVERKSATADWSKIGFAEGHGSTKSPKYYSYSDKPTGTGKFSYRLKQIDNDGQFEYGPIVEVLVDNLPNGFVLEQNFPNPFNPETSIRFALKEETKASLKVFNAMGEEVATLFDGVAEAGRYYNLKFSGDNLSSGFYIYKLVAGEHVSVRKMLLMK